MGPPGQIPDDRFDPRRPEKPLLSILNGEGISSDYRCHGPPSRSFTALRQQRRTEMLFMTTYRLKSHLKKSDVKRLMDEFGKRGAAPGEIAHYVRIDGSGGVSLSESDDVNAAYEYTLAFTEFMEFDVTPVLKIDDAVGPILAYVGDG
jgi:hypothetical protein